MSDTRTSAFQVVGSRSEFEQNIFKSVYLKVIQ